MPTADLVDDRLVLTGVEYRDRDAVRLVPGLTFRNGVWSGPVTWTGLRILNSVFRDRLNVGTALSGWAWRESAGRIVPATESRDRAMDPSIRLDIGPEALYPFQTTGVAFLDVADGAVLADDMGTGKTAQVIATLEQRKAYPALVVCPKTAKGVWREQFAEWAPHRDVCVVTGSANQRRRQLDEPHDVFVVNWEQLRVHSRLARFGSIRLTEAEREVKELNRPWAAVIADEAHRALSPKAKQTRALWAVRETAELGIPVTGTPIADTPDDLWALLHFIAPQEWPSRTKYIDRYCETSWNAFGGVDIIGLKAATRDEFHALIGPRLLRRPKALVLPWLPEKRYVRREVEMSPGQAKAYRQFRDEMVADLDGGLGMALDNLSMMTRLTQLASASMQVVDDGDGETHLRMCAPSSKVDDLVELLGEMGDDPLVVFAQSRQLIELAAVRLEREKISHTMVVGGQTELTRDLSVTGFQRGEHRVILCTMGAGSESITLTRADTCCFMQRSWSLIENQQAENRTDRPGQESDKLLVIDMVTPGTIEERQRDVLWGKDNRFQEVVRDREALRGIL